jgi:hypothetical protein
MIEDGGIEGGIELQPLGVMEKIRDMSTCSSPEKIQAATTDNLFGVSIMTQSKNAAYERLNNIYKECRNRIIARDFLRVVTIGETNNSIENFLNYIKRQLEIYKKSGIISSTSEENSNALININLLLLCIPKTAGRNRTRRSGIKNKKTQKMHKKRTKRNIKRQKKQRRTSKQ